MLLRCAPSAMPHADVVRALRDQVRHHAVHADHREDQRERRERAQHRCVEKRCRASESCMRSCIVRMSYTGIVGSTSWISRTIARGDRGRIGRRPRHLVRQQPERRTIDDDAAVDVEAILLHRADDADDRQLAASDRSTRACRSRSPFGQKRCANFSSMIADRLARCGMASKSVKNRPFTSGIFHRPEIVGRRARADRPAAPGRAAA